VPTAAVNGVELYFEVEGAGRPILGVHGTPSSAVLWESAAQTLGRYGRCITYDRRGFHRSPLPPRATCDLADQVNDAVALLESLHAVPATVVGRSTGGLVALALAHQRPDLLNGLVLLEPAVFTLDPAAQAWAGQLRDAVLLVATTRPSAVAETVVRATLGDEVWDSLPGDLQEVFVAANVGTLAELHGHGLDLSADPWRPSNEDLASMRVPALVVSATESPEPLRVVAGQLAGALPSAYHVRVPGGHLIDPSGEPVIDFLTRSRGPLT
jgi:pimeloyl-ACP methyl ester carboxylesterase